MMTLPLLLLMLMTVETDRGPGLRVDSDADAVLVALHQRGEDLRTLSASVTLSEIDEAVGDEVIRTGRFWLGNDPTDTRARVRFETRQSGTRVREEVVEYLLAGDMLIERHPAQRREIRRRVLREGEKIDLLKLGEGPFPLPIGQEPEEVRRLFEVSVEPPTDTGPAQTVRLRLRPRPGTQFSRQFETMDVWVSLSDAFPRRIEVDDANAGILRRTDLNEIRMNQQVDPRQLRLEPINPREWDVIDETTR